MSIRNRLCILLLVFVFIFSGYNVLFNISDDFSTISITRFASGSFSGGDSSFLDPYQISNIDQLQDVSSNLTANYVIINDIDASATAGWNNGMGFIPIGNSSSMFNGSLDGKGHVISNLFISSDDYLAGLLSIVSNNSIINNVHLKNVKISGKWYAGGIAGKNNGLIINCSVSGEISGKLYAGGLAGLMDSGNGDTDCRILKSKANVIVHGSDRTGGIVGYGVGGIIDRCSSQGEIFGYTMYYGGVGGLVGGGGLTIDECFSNCTVHGEDFVGGLLGRFSGNVLNSYSLGNVFANGSAAGGLIGYVERGKLYDCYSIGYVSKVPFSGGLVGDHYFSTANYCYWDMERSSCASSPLGTGKSTKNMQQRSTFSAWDFNSIWNIIEKDSYPFHLSANLSFVRIDNIPDLFAKEDSFFSIDINATSDLPGGSGAFWNFSTNGGNWLSISNTGILSGIPLNEDVGIFWVNISATLNFYIFDRYNFTLNVINVNDPPEIGTIKLSDATEDLFYSCPITAIDIDPTPDTLSWSIETNSDFLSINKENGVLSGLPTNDDVGYYWINVIVNDGNGGSDNMNKSINVFNINDVPIITPFSIDDVLEDTLMSIDIEGYDIDPSNDRLSWGIRTNADFLSIEKETGILSGIPENDDVGKCWVEIDLSDNKGGITKYNSSFSVINVNDDPIIQDYTPPDFNEDEDVFIVLKAIDIDPTKDILTWSMTTNTNFLNINEKTGSIYGLPTQNDVGKWWINASVQDGNGGSDYILFQITIINKNDIPEPINERITITLDEDEVISIDLDELFLDEDNDLLSFTSISSDNISVSIDRNIALIKPLENWFGNEEVIIDAHDSLSSNSMILELKVISVNDPPIIRKIDARSVYHGVDYQVFSSIVDDPDLIYGDELSYRWTSNISGEIGTDASINVSLPLGIHNITLTVEDVAGSRSSLSVIVSIEEADPINHHNDDKTGKEVLIIILIISLITIIIGSTIGYLMLKKRKPTKEIELPIPFRRAPAIDSLIVPENGVLLESEDVEDNNILNPKQEDID